METPPATAVDTDRLAELEAVIARGIETFVDVGVALLTIKMDRLYIGAGFASYDEYIVRRWDMDKRYGNRLIVAASISQTIVNELGPMGPAPVNERQVRPLAALPEAERVQVWQEAIDVAGGERPTGAQVEEVVRAKLAKALPTKPVPKSNVVMLTVRPPEEHDEQATDRAAAMELARRRGLAWMRANSGIKNARKSVREAKTNLGRWTPRTKGEKSAAVRAVRDLEAMVLALREAVEAREVEP